MKANTNRAIVKKIEEESFGSLVMPVDPNPELTKAEVVQVDDRCTVEGNIIETPFKEGDVVFFMTSYGYQIPGSDLMAVEINKIIAIEPKA